MADFPLAGVKLKLPDGFTVQALDAGDGSDREAVIRFAKKSPDRTVYHAPPYFQFARSQTTRPGIKGAELILVSHNSNPLFALPAHPQGRSILTHYSGVLFPEGSHEATLRRAVQALVELMAANRHLRFSCLQAPVAPAYEDAARTTLLESLLAGCGVPLERTYTRMLPVGERTYCKAALGSRSNGDSAEAVAVDRTALEGEQL